MPKIPKVLHYCFGYDPQFGGKPWSLVHFVCVKSAIERINPHRAFLYYEYEPQGPWWELTRELLTPVKISAPRHIFGNTLSHPAHRADVVRLETLIRDGGIYLDADVLVHESFDRLLDHSVVLGEEGIRAEYGLGNSVILAEPGAPFLRRWHEHYRSFDRNHWNAHSVRLPLVLSQSYPDEITVLPHTAFHWPLHTPEHLDLIYGAAPSADVRGGFANHLWESKAWETHLEHLTPGLVRKIDSNFHRWARPFVTHLPDDYGCPSLPEKCIRFARIQKRRLHSAIRATMSATAKSAASEAEKAGTPRAHAE